MRRITFVSGGVPFFVWYRYRPDRPATLDDPGEEESVEIEEVQAVGFDDAATRVISTTFMHSIQEDADLLADIEKACLADWYYITRRAEEGVEPVVLPREGA